MIEIRIHGRGGQGAVIASEVLASAFFKEGKFVQAFPAFGVERRGAPVTAFTRVDDQPIRIRNFIYEPDHILILDPTLIESTQVDSGLKENGWIIINTDRPPKAFGQFSKFRVATVDANRIAIENKLGSPTAPIVNTAILGAFSKITGMVSVDAVIEAVKEFVPSNKAGNAAATKEAYDRAIA
ncbi:MAG: 2-oxoacid:acceptor oxidoreductase family protein [Deltaproteobacteria bacterium]|nr:2-oxoacid:acceptor oxidoreductase family protein [Deltaproteobacteria bacterium]